MCIFLFYKIFLYFVFNKFNLFIIVYKINLKTLLKLIIIYQYSLFS